jgi:Rieske Fe-S protein
MSAGVTRRSALAAAAAAAVGVVAGIVYGRNSDAAKAPPGTAGYGYGSGGSGGSAGHKKLTSLASVPAAGGVITQGYVVVRDPGDTVHAFSSVCTHLGCDVNKVSSGKIFCPCHGSVFDAQTGAVVQGPASSPLPKLPVTVENGDVFTA